MKKKPLISHCFFSSSKNPSRSQKALYILWFQISSLLSVSESDKKNLSTYHQLILTIQSICLAGIE